MGVAFALLKGFLEGCYRLASLTIAPFFFVFLAFLYTLVLFLQRNTLLSTEKHATSRGKAGMFFSEFSYVFWKKGCGMLPKTQRKCVCGVYVDCRFVSDMV